MYSHSARRNRPPIKLTSTPRPNGIAIDQMAMQALVQGRGKIGLGWECRRTRRRLVHNVCGPRDIGIAECEATEHIW